MTSSRAVSVRFSFPVTDVSTTAWLSCQANVGRSLQTVIRAWIEHYGYQDAVNYPIGAIPSDVIPMVSDAPDHREGKAKDVSDESDISADDEHSSSEHDGDGENTHSTSESEPSSPVPARGYTDLPRGFSDFLTQPGNPGTPLQ